MPKSTRMGSNGGCQSLPQSTSIGSHPLLMVDVKIYHSQLVLVHTLCWWWMSKSTAVNKNGFTTFADGRCQSLPQLTKMGSHPFLMVDIKVCYSQKEIEYITTFAESICIYKVNEWIPENESWLIIYNCKYKMNVHSLVQFYQIPIRAKLLKVIFSIGKY